MKGNVCRVCGYEYKDFFPWGETGKIASFAICDCCGTEFGYEDNSIESTQASRKKWISEGAQWFNIEAKPRGWSLEKQLKNIPEIYL